MTKHKSAAFIAKKYLGFAPILSASILYKIVTATLALLLVACGGGGGGGGGAASPATTVANFNVVPYADGMTLSWSNPNRADIASINLSWAAYAANDLSRDTAGDGYLIISNSTQTAAAAANAYNITIDGQSDVGEIADGFVIGGATLTLGNAYVFSSQLYFKGAGNSTTAAAPQLPDITAPRVPRSLGANPDADSFADTQVYSVGSPRSASDGGNVTLSWINPRVGSGNITSVTLSYQSNRSSNDRGRITLTASEQLLGDGSEVSYIWTGLEPGLYNFTIAPILGGIFAGIEVVPGMPMTRVFPPAAANQITPIATTDRADTITGLFPDDGDVQYILTITQQDNITNPMLSVIPSSANANVCSIALTSAMPSYISNGIVNQTSATYNVTGVAAGGTCGIRFQVTEDGRSVTLSRSITFSPEQAPLLRADVMGDQTAQIKVPAQLNVTIVINATKQDGSNTRDVTFPAVVASSSTPSCTATLIGGDAGMPRQYDGIIAATSTAAATYNVSSPNIDIVSVANCGSFLFRVTEGSATSNSNLAGGISFDERNDKNLAPMVTTTPLDDVVRFPDDGPVSYTLNITKRDILLNPILNATASITGSCSIAPTGVTELDYDAENKASTDYTIIFTGTATAGGTCNVNFIVTEDGIMVALSTRSITFNAEQAPTLVAVLLGNATGDSENVPADQAVRVNVTATKQDGSNTPSITFPASIISSSMPSCTATLAGSPTRQYNGVIASTSAVTVTYNVRPTILGAIDNCGTFIFNATEGSVTGTAEITHPTRISFVIEDADNDGIADGVDVDADGDGLIELSTAAQLNMMRNNLAGTGLDADNSDGNLYAGGDDTGCGGGTYANGTVITTCNGYELMADIDLNDLESDTSMSNWERVGSCTASQSSSCTSNAFTGNFDGNKNQISNMRINLPEATSGHGFFGSVANADIRNIILTNASMLFAPTDDGQSRGYIGVLVGYGNNLNITFAAVTIQEILGATAVDINGRAPSIDFSIGALVGRCVDCTITSSATLMNRFSGIYGMGGLAGHLFSSKIFSSVAVTNDIKPSRVAWYGGLIGGLYNGGEVAFSTAITNTETNMNIHRPFGGLVGLTSSSFIHTSYALQLGGMSALAGAVSGDNFLDDNDINTNVVTVVESSYYNATATGPGASSGRGTALDMTQLQPTAFADDGNGGNFTAWADGWCDTTTGEFTQDRNSDLATGVNANGVPAWDLVPDGPTRGDNSFPIPACTPFSPATLRTAIGKVRNAESPVPIER